MRTAVSTEEKEIAPVAIIECEMWGRVAYPSLNKNNTLESNDAEIRIERNTNECKITEVVILSDEDYEQFCNSFLADQVWLDGKGGAESRNSHLCPLGVSYFELSTDEQRLWREGAYGLAIAVTTQDAKDVLIVNPQGYSYARYVGRGNDELVQEIKTFVSSKMSARIAITSYTVITEDVSYAPISWTQSPQQELKNKLTSINVDQLSAEQISQLLQILG